VGMGSLALGEDEDRVRVEERERGDPGTSESEGTGYDKKGGIRIDDKEARFFLGILYSSWVYAR
jgi:hypothetical protein